MNGSSSSSSSAAVAAAAALTVCALLYRLTATAGTFVRRRNRRPARLFPRQHLQPRFALPCSALGRPATVVKTTSGTESSSARTCCQSTRRAITRRKQRPELTENRNCCSPFTQHVQSS